MKKLATILLLFVFLPLLAIPLNGQTGIYPQSKRLTEDWEFYRGDLGSVWEALRTGRPAELPAWESVTLPHSYNAHDAVDPDIAYYQGPAWYKTHLDISNPYPNGRTLLHFEGAGQKTKIFLYDKFIAEHVGGYDEFTIDITDAVRQFRNHPEAENFDGMVPISVRTDNSRDTEMIPSDLSDFTIYGGLYRYVNLVYVPEISINQLHLQPVLSKDHSSCSVTISARLYNPDKKNIEIPLHISINAPGGAELQSFTKKIPAGEEKAEFSFKLVNPELWSPHSPALYNLSIEYDINGEKVLINEHLGVRSFRFIKKGAFLLNGESLLLRGTHRHEDHAGVGPAMTEEMILTEMKLMKEMGVNFIRLGHYQQSRIVLNACDSLGILVWEEIPWCRGGLGGEKYREQARRMLTNMINQHYNHPSVIIWGLGNENDWPGDFPEFEKDSIRMFMHELNSLAHRLDPSRKTAIRRCDFCKDIVDVYSPSIWAGWYRGKYTDYRDVSRSNMEEVDHFLHVEWGASHHARRHSENPDQGLDQITSSELADERAGDFLMSGGEPRVSRDGDWTESYAVNLIDWHLKEQENMDWLTGTAYWPFKDFSTPLRPENPVPYVNQKGVTERDLTKKESFYVFQSYWTEKPMVRIYSHSWPTRWGKADEKKMVKVYSNCPEVELFLNGESCGIKKRNSQDFPAAGLRWIVSFQEGDNELIALGRKNKIEVSDTIQLSYQTEEWGEPAGFALEEVSRKSDTITLRASLRDKEGIICLDAGNFVRFGISGDGLLLDNQGTSQGSRKIQLYNGIAEIQLKLKKGESYVSVSGHGITTAFLRVER